MIEYKIKNHDGRVYLRDELKNVLRTPELRVIADAEAVLLFSDDIPLKRIQSSIKLIAADVKNRADLEGDISG